MTFIYFFLTAVVLISSAYRVHSQAPGDFEGRCDEAATAYEADWRVLLDSYRYRSLTELWKIEEFDGDSSSFTNVGGECDRGFFACNPAPQNDWIFSQLIHTLSAKEIFFTVNLVNCFQEPCTDHVSLHVNNSIINNSSRTDVTKYKRLTDQNSQKSTNTILSSFKRESSGIYFGIQDTGLCGIIGRVILYYRACPERQSGLVVYPETSLPPRNEPAQYFQASCVKNAHNVTSLQVRASGSEGTCRDVVSTGARCKCNRGYFEQDGTCLGCQAGTYGSVGGMCLSCPKNSDSKAPGATRCECRPGFYRSSQDAISQPCTVPPEAVTNLREGSAQNTSIILLWNKPTVVGRSDFYYNISISDPANFGLWIVINDHFQTDSEKVTFTITGLQAATSYEIRVSTHNGVSDQDPENNGRRTASIISRTKQGVPGIPELHRFCNVIFWRQPSVTGGILTGYDLIIGSTEIHLSHTENFYVTSATQKQANVLVQIRANNAVFSSHFSLPQTIGCEEQSGCSQVTDATTAAPPPTTTSTPPATTAPPPTTVTPPPTTVTPPPTTVTPPPCQLSRPVFVLNDATYQNNSQVRLQDVGQGNQALRCRTSSLKCCRDQRIGEFYYPNNSTVGINSAGEQFYRNRRGSEVILNRRPDSTGPLGQYRCEILNECDEKVSLYITLV